MKSKHRLELTPEEVMSLDECRAIMSVAVVVDYFGTNGLMEGSCMRGMLDWDLAQQSRIVWC